jgi:hypothetical protein
MYSKFHHFPLIFKVLHSLFINHSLQHYFTHFLLKSSSLAIDPSLNFPHFIFNFHYFLHLLLIFKENFIFALVLFLNFYRMNFIFPMILIFISHFGLFLTFVFIVYLLLVVLWTVIFALIEMKFSLKMLFETLLFAFVFNLIIFNRITVVNFLG